MPVVTLFPESTVAPEFVGIGVVGALTAHEALSDASDLSYVNLQLTSLEDQKWFRGELQDLPAGAGVVNSVLINTRADSDTFADNLVDLLVGDYPTARITDQLTASIADYDSGSLTDLDVAEVNAAQWMAGGTYTNGASPVNARIYELSFVVDFNYVNRVSIAMIFELLGPLVAVGLGEMPKLAAEVLRRGRVRLHPHELPLVWRDLRESPRRRYVFA